MRQLRPEGYTENEWRSERRSRQRAREIEGGLVVIGTVAHEAVHAAWDLLEVCGVKVDVTNQEALAFLSAWFAKTMLDLFPVEMDGAA